MSTPSKSVELPYHFKNGAIEYTINVAAPPEISTLATCFRKVAMHAWKDKNGGAPSFWDLKKRREGLEITDKDRDHEIETQFTDKLERGFIILKLHQSSGNEGPLGLVLYCKMDGSPTEDLQARLGYDMVRNMTKCSEERPRYWRLDSSAVLPELQGQGLGKELIKLALRRMQQDERIPVFSSPRDESIPIYKTVDFRSVLEQTPNFMVRLADAEGI